MSVLKRIALVVLLLAASLAPSHAAERILLFISDVQVEPDGELRVVETIRVQAEGREIRRGILRDFPTLYHRPDGARVEVGFDVESVTRDGRPEDFATERLSNGVRVRIGRADVMLDTGVHQYVISYRTTRQIGYFAAFDELYWNATGTGWTLPIDVAEARITLPERVPFRQSALYTGPQDARGKDAIVVEQQPGRIVFRTTKPLPPRNGLTVAAGWDKGLVAQPGAGLQAYWWLRDNLPLAVAGLGLLLFAGYYGFAWLRVGRDGRGGTVIPLFAPPQGMSAAAMRYLWRMDYDQRVLAVAMLDLAVHRHLRISDSDGSMQIERLDDGQPIGPAEQAVQKKLFASDNAVLLSDTNHAVLGRAGAALKSALTGTYGDNMFRHNTRWAAWGVFAWFVLIAAVLTSLIVTYDKNSAAGVMLGTVFLSPLVMGAAYILRSKWRNPAQLWSGATEFVLVFGFLGGGITLLILMARDWVEFSGFATSLAAAPLVTLSFSWLKAPTAAGARLMNQIEGLRHYLGVAEEDRLATLHPPEKTPELFERLLPYAVALEVENAWAERFAGVLAAAAAGAPVATWYTGNRELLRDPGGLADRLGSQLSETIASASTAPGSTSGSSSSGSGSSGSSDSGSSGGGGGGGGGSGW